MTTATPTNYAAEIARQTVSISMADLETWLLAKLVEDDTKTGLALYAELHEDGYKVGRRKLYNTRKDLLGSKKLRDAKKAATRQIVRDHRDAKVVILTGGNGFEWKLVSGDVLKMATKKRIVGIVTYNPDRCSGSTNRVKDSARWMVSWQKIGWTRSETKYLDRKFPTREAAVQALQDLFSGETTVDLYDRPVACSRAR